MKNAVILGTFDGLHPGHRAVIENAFPYRTVAVTFRLPPKFSLGSGGGLLMLPEDKCRALEALGVSEIKMLDFEQVRGLSPEEFLSCIESEYAPARICCGYNYRFGKNASGDTALLAEFCGKRGIEFRCIDCVRENGQPISSTALRTLLSDGDVETADKYIYGGFGFKAEVIHGDARGRTLGFPTVNQKYPDMLAPLKYGVYTARIEFDGKCYSGISNIGVRPTFETAAVYAETYIKNFSGDIYGRTVTLKPQRFLRPEKKFSSVDELKAAVMRDISAVDE